MNKKAVELSINFVVILIISLVVLGMGIYLLRMFVGTADDIKTNLDQQIEQKIQALLDSGERVVFPISKRDIKRGKSDVFGLGIRNVLGEKAVFDIYLEEGIFVDLEKEVYDYWPCGSDDEECPQYKTELRDYVIENNENEIVTIPVRAQGKKGTYVLNVRVTCELLDGSQPEECNPYGYTKAYITIP